MKSAHKRLAFAGVAMFALMGADNFDIKTQIGPHPVLPAPQQYLFPPMKLAKVIGWKPGETPKVAADLKIAALGTGFEHPRSFSKLFKTKTTLLLMEFRQSFN